VIELRFHPEYYNGFCIDEAVQTFAGYASADYRRENGNFIVTVNASQKALDEGLDERTVALELANYALGLTIERVRGGGMR
jgi:hypothetical protein